jgi:hypothetical protein
VTVHVELAIELFQIQTDCGLDRDRSDADNRRTGHDLLRGGEEDDVPLGITAKS